MAVVPEANTSLRLILISSDLLKEMKRNYNPIPAPKQKAWQNKYITRPLLQADGHKDFAVYHATLKEQVKTKC